MLLRIFGLIALVFLQFRCFKKNKNTADLQEWLDQAFPGRFMVVSTSTADPIKHLSFKVKNSIVAEKNDSLVSAEIRWDKREAGLGLDKTAIEGMFESARQAQADARALAVLLYEAGMQDHSLALVRGEVILLAPSEIEKKQRLACINALKTALQKWQQTRPCQVTICLINPVFLKNAELGDVFSLNYWQVNRSEILRKSPLLQTFPDHTEALDATLCDAQWRVNPESDHCTKIIEKLRPEATAWAEKHLKQPATLMETVETETLYAPPGIRISFGVLYHTPADGEYFSAEGYISTEYRLESEAHTGWKYQKSEVQ